MLTVQGLHKIFTSHILNGKKITGFSQISFHVPKGTALGLSAPSGYGKSSVLKCIYRSYLPSAGHIFYESDPLGRVDLATAQENTILRLRQGEMGYVTQFLSVLPRISAVDVVAEPLMVHGEAPSDARQKAAVLLKRLRIDEHLFEAFPSTFSGGEKQRVNIARAVIRPPKLLLLDEPTASLDPVSMEIVLNILSELKSEGTTMVTVFHDRTVMERLTDGIYTMPEKKEPPNE